MNRKCSVVGCRGKPIRRVHTVCHYLFLCRKDNAYWQRQEERIRKAIEENDDAREALKARF